MKRVRPWALAGFSGSGKSTVARLLAAASGRQVIDLDEIIGDDRILELLAAGEPALREAEARGLAAIAAGPRNVVVALGGGALEGEASRRVLRDGGFLVAWLDAPLSECLARCAAEGRRRPVLEATRQAGAGALASLYARRGRAAEMTLLRVDAGAPAEDVARFLLHTLLHADAATESPPREGTGPPCRGGRPSDEGS